MSTHFIGIKGTGMSALAGILNDKGIDVTGSDIEKYVFTQEGLKERGIDVLPFDAANIHDGDVVIAGLAFGPDHPEVKAALANPNVKVFWYNEYLGHLLEDYNSICVAGCHGKSTTTGLLAHVLGEWKPTGYLIGDGHGHMPDQAENFVLESCEFKRHFLAYHPDYALITNIDFDHVDYYRDMADYISAYQSFVEQVGKKVIYFGDDSYLPGLAYTCPTATYGMKEGNTYQGINLVQDEHGSHLDVKYGGQIIAHLELNESGMPFAWDALGAFAMAHELGMPADLIAHQLSTFGGIARRFVIEEAGDSVLVDDYAHHPRAISLMIQALRSRYPGRKIVALYKPDRYSRLQYFLDGFADALNEADESAVLDFDANIKPEDETITVTIDDLLSRLNHGSLLSIDQASARALAAHGPAVYVFMSSKNIYLLRDLLRQELEG